MAEAKKRNSSIELLRLVCIFGIIFMHTIAYGGSELSENNRYILIMVNCVTNLGVTCFMLISGYFGVKFDLAKLVKLELMVLFYSVLHLLIRLVLKTPVGGMDVVSTAFPILSNSYWYMTVYFMIAIASPFLNQIPEKLTKANFQKLLLILLFFSSIVPTFLSFDLLGREGKNVIHMTMIYLIGRYIKLYADKPCEKGKVGMLLAGNLILTMILELGLYVFTGGYSLFYRDCSLFTVCSAILLFTLFRNMYFENRIINKLAGSVLAVYVFSYGFQRLIYVLIPLEEYAKSPLLFPLICVFAPCVVVGCMLFDLIRQSIFGTIETKLADCIAGTLQIFSGKITKKIGNIFREEETQ